MSQSIDMVVMMDENENLGVDVFSYNDGNVYIKVMLIAWYWGP